MTGLAAAHSKFYQDLADIITGTHGQQLQLFEFGIDLTKIKIAIRSTHQPYGKKPMAQRWEPKQIHHAHLLQDRKSILVTALLYPQQWHIDY